MNIVFAISEVEELVKTGGLADVGKALPLALKSPEHTVSVFMPYYRAIAEQFSLSEACSSQTLFAESKVYHYAVLSLTGTVSTFTLLTTRNTSTGKVCITVRMKPITTTASASVSSAARY